MDKNGVSWLIASANCPHNQRVRILVTLVLLHVGIFASLTVGQVPKHVVKSVGKPRPPASETPGTEAPGSVSSNLIGNTAGINSSEITVKLSQTKSGSDRGFNPDFSSGSFRYEVPFLLPPARAGHSPTLTLAYHSRAGNGIAGVGWSLNDIAIERRPNPILDYRSNDFVLREGHATVPLIAGTSSPGNMIYNAQFRDPSYELALVEEGENVFWKRVYKNGVVEIFGASDSSRVSSDGGTFAWLLSSSSDALGNTILYSYEVKDGEKYLRLIAYSGPLNGFIEGTSTCRNLVNYYGCIEFSYESRDDREISFSRGAPHTRSVRLDSVSLFSEGINYDVYAMDYEASDSGYSSNSGRTLLSSVRRTGIDGSSEQTIATFEYSAAPVQWVRNRWPSAQRRTPVNQMRLLGDFNGDGRTDISYLPEWEKCSGSTCNWKIYISTGSGWRGGTAEAWHPGPKQRYCATLFGPECVDWYGEVLMPVPWAGIVSDFTGDGRSDLLWSAPLDNCRPDRPKVPPSQNDLCNPDNWLMNTTKVDGTGWMSTAFWPDGPRVTSHDPLNPSNPIRRYSLTAMCQPGRFYESAGTSLACFDENAKIWRVARANQEGTGWLTESWAGPVADANEHPRDWAERCHFGDLNGDRFTDLACQDMSQPHIWQVGIRDQSGWRVENWTFAGDAKIGTRCVTGDFNSDGLTDLSCDSPDNAGSWTTVLSSGRGWAAPNVNEGPAYADGETCLGADVNGDQRSDILCSTSEEGVFAIALVRPSGKWAQVTWKVGSDATTYLVENFCSLGDFGGLGTLSAACVAKLPSGYVQDGFSVSKLSNPFPDSLTQITDMSGSITKVAYSTSSDFRNLRLPYPMKVLSGWSVKHSISAPPVESQVRYADGYFDPEEQEFLGFGYVEIKEGEKTEEFWYDGTELVVPTARSRARLQRTRFSISTEKTETAYDYFESPSPDGPFFDPTRSIRAERFNCDSSGCGELVSRKITFFEYDDRGNRTGAMDFRDQEVEGLLNLSSYLKDSGITRKESSSSYAVTQASNLTYETLKARAVSSPNDYLTALAKQSYFGLVKRTEFSYEGSSRCGPNDRRLPAPTEIRQSVDSHTVTTTWFGYDSSGNLICTQDANAEVTETEFDAGGMHVKSVTHPNGTKTTFEHFALADLQSGNVRPGQLKSFSLNGEITGSIRYDELGRILQYETSAGRFERYYYRDQKSEMTSSVKVLNSRGLITETTYDANGQPLRIHQSGPEKKWTNEVFIRDKYGNLVEHHLPKFDGDPAEVVRYTYDPLNRLRTTARSGTITSTICYRGDRLTTRDSKGHIKFFKFNARGNLLAESTAELVAETCDINETEGKSLLRVQIERDSLDRPIKMTDGGGAKFEFSYDNLDRIVSLNDGGGLKSAFQYDGVGNLTFSQNPDGTSVTLDYNSMGQLLSQTRNSLSGKQSTKFRYNSTGRLESIENPESKTIFKHDRNGRLAGIRRISDGFWWSKWRSEVALVHNNVGQLAIVALPDGRKYNYEYDVGALSKIVSGDSGQPLVRFSEFDAHGRWRQKSFISGVTESRSFNERGWLESLLLSKGGSQMHKLEYDYDSQGNPIKVVANDKTYSLQYDSADRITKIVPSDSAPEEFTYNGSGSLTRASSIGDYSYDQTEQSKHPHSPSSVGRSHIGSDSNGRINETTDYKLVYDVNGQITRIRKPGGNVRIRYDGLGSFDRIRSGGYKSNFFFFDYYACLQGLCSTAVPGDQGGVAQIDKNGKPLFLHRDPLGTTYSITDGDGTVVWSGLDLPFFPSDTGLEPSPNVFDAFALGRKIPKNDSIVKMGSRYFDTETNIFLQPDPLSPQQTTQNSLNRFAYGNNNPFRFIDRSGLMGFELGYSNSLRFEFGGQMNFDLNIFRVPAFNHELFNQDLQKFYEKLNQMNAERFAEYTANPVKFLRDNRMPGSVFGLPRITGGDYQRGSLRPPPFAGISTGDLVNNIRIGKHLGRDELGGIVFAYLVAPRLPGLSLLGEGAWDFKAGTRGIRNLDHLLAENAGNFNYGAVGGAMGFSLDTLLKAAGAENWAPFNAKYMEGYKRGTYGQVMDTPPYADDDLDQYWIRRGYEYYNTNAAEIEWLFNSN